MYTDNDWTAVVANWRKSGNKWAGMSRIIGQEGENLRTPGKISMMVIQEELLFGSEIWVATPHIGRMLGGFHHRVALRLIGKQPQMSPYGGWDSPPPHRGGEEIREAVLEEVDT